MIAARVFVKGKVGLIGSLCVLGLSGGLAWGGTVTVAESGGAAPGAGLGAVFQFLGVPQINGGGVVAFEGTLMSGGAIDSTNDEGIWVGPAAGVSLFVREGSLTPDSPLPVLTKIEFSDFGLVRLNDVGRVAFEAEETVTNILAGSTVVRDAIWAGPAGGLELAARQDPTGGGASVPPLIGDSPLAGLLYNDVGSVGFTSFQNLWVGPPGGVFNEVSTFDPPPGAPSGQFFSGYDPVRLNNAEQVAFGSRLFEPLGSVPDDEDDGVWMGNFESLELIALEGQEAPGLGGAVFGPGAFDVDRDAFHAISFNDAGQMAFDATAINEGPFGGIPVLGIWFGTPGDVGLVAATFGAVPGGPAGAEFLGFDGDVVLDNQGRLAFGAQMREGPGGVAESNNDGLWMGTSSGLSLIAREGSEAGGVPAGQVFSSFGEPQLSGAGQVLFEGGLRGAGVTAGNRNGIWLADGREQVLVARDGDDVDGATVLTLVLPGDATGEGGLSSSVNGFGQVTYLAVFEDLSQAVRVFTPDLRWRGGSFGSWDTAGNWTLGIAPGEVHGVFLDPVGGLTVTGPRESAVVKSLEVGGGTGVATLSLGGGVLESMGAVQVLAKGVVTGDGVIRGGLDNFGVLLADAVTVEGRISNHGLVTGDGAVTAIQGLAPAFLNESDGHVLADGGGRLVLGSTTNDNEGLVEVIGAELRVGGDLLNFDGATVRVIGGTLRVLAGPVTNLLGGEIFASDAVIDFGAIRMNNGGTFGVTFGTSFVSGKMLNTGDVIVTGGASVTFFDDVENNGLLRVRDGSTAVFFGDVSGDGSFPGGGTVFFEGAFSPGLPSLAGSVLIGGDAALGSGSELVLTLVGTGPGEFDRVSVVGELSAGGVLSVGLGDGFVPELGDVFEVLDFGAVSGGFRSVSLPELGRGLRLDASGLLVDGRLVVVPEPGAAAVLVVGLGVVGFRGGRGRGRGIVLLFGRRPLCG